MNGPGHSNYNDIYQKIKENIFFKCVKHCKIIPNVYLNCNEHFQHDYTDFS